MDTVSGLLFGVGCVFSRRRTAGALRGIGESEEEARDEAAKGGKWFTASFLSPWRKEEGWEGLQAGKQVAPAPACRARSSACPCLRKTTGSCGLGCRSGKLGRGGPGKWATFCFSFSFCFLF